MSGVGIGNGAGAFALSSCCPTRRVLPGPVSCQQQHLGPSQGSAWKELARAAHQLSSSLQQSATRPQLRCRAQMEEQDTMRQLAEALEASMEDGAGSPRFQPFIAESEERTALLALKQEVQTKDGLLSMRPIAEAWIPAATELLTDAFAEAMGYRPAFRRYLLKEINGYLHKHLNLPPKAIIIMGLLQQPGPDDSLLGDGISSSAGAASSEDASTLRSDSLASSPSIGSTASSTGVAAPSSDGQTGILPSASSPEQSVSGTDPSSIHSRDGKAAEIASKEPVHDSDPEAASEAASEGIQQSSSAGSTTTAHDFMDSDHGFCRGSAVEDPPAESAAPSAPAAESFTSGEPAGDGPADPTAAIAEPDHASTEGTEQQWPSLPDPELVGCVELSFSATTRQPRLLLTPPRDCAYLCNMAVDPAWRRQGYGQHLLRIAEVAAGIAGKQEIYLHVRHQDEPASKLYQRGGYSIVKSDPAFIRWFGLDPKHLLRKVLSPFK